jgi:hypothetical protein
VPGSILSRGLGVMRLVDERLTSQALEGTGDLLHVDIR